MEVLGKAGLDGVVAAVEDEACHLVIARQDLVVDEREHLAAPAFAGLDFEFALGGWPDNEVLQQAASGDTGPEFGICRCVAMTPDIAR